jgi:hypothetical protein
VQLRKEEPLIVASWVVASIAIAPPALVLPIDSKTQSRTRRQLVVVEIRREQSLTHAERTWEGRRKRERSIDVSEL